MFGRVLNLSLVGLNQNIHQQSKLVDSIQTKLFHILGYSVDITVYLFWVTQISAQGN